MIVDASVLRAGKEICPCKWAGSKHGCAECECNAQNKNNHTVEQLFEWKKQLETQWGRIDKQREKHKWTKQQPDC